MRYTVGWWYVRKFGLYWVLRFVAPGFGSTALHSKSHRVRCCCSSVYHFSAFNISLVFVPQWVARALKAPWFGVVGVSVGSSSNVLIISSGGLVVVHSFVRTICGGDGIVGVAIGSQGLRLAVSCFRSLSVRLPTRSPVYPPVRPPTRPSTRLLARPSARPPARPPVARSLARSPVRPPARPIARPPTGPPARETDGLGGGRVGGRAGGYRCSKLAHVRAGGRVGRRTGGRGH